MTNALRLIDAHCGGGSDALIEEVVLAAPDAGIVIGFGLKQADDGANAVSAMEGLWNGLCGLAEWPARGEADGA